MKVTGGFLNQEKMSKVFVLSFQVNPAFKSADPDALRAESKLCSISALLAYTRSAGACKFCFSQPRCKPKHLCYVRAKLCVVEL